MFKVIENDDGTTNIFCNLTGKLVSVVNQRKLGTNNNQQLKKEAKPSQANKAFKANQNLRQNALSNHAKSERRLRYEARESTETCDFQSSFDPDDNEEPHSDPCITQDDFLRRLNVVNSAQLQEQGAHSLAATFPLRLTSRRKPPLPRSLPQVKLCEFMDICSPLGQKLCQSSQAKCSIDEESALNSIERYDIFCRDTSLNDCTLPNLRCFGTKISPKNRFHKRNSSEICKLENVHVYCFNKRQRRERMKHYKSLDKTRKLIRFCNKKQLRVSIIRLPQNTLEKYGVRIPEMDNWKTHSYLAAGRSLAADLYRNKLLAYSETRIFRCFVKVNNVMEIIHKVGKDYFIKGTTTKVFMPNSTDKVQRSNHFLGLSYQANNSALMHCVRNDHSYYSSEANNELTRAITMYSLSNHSNIKSSTSMATFGFPLKFDNLGLINLSEDLNVSSSSMSNTDDVCFIGARPAIVRGFHHCYGCKMSRSYCQLEQMKKDAKTHLQYYHCVSRPDDYLNIYVDNKHKTIVETFVGYKGDI